mmetsp:Transcript_136448/g.308351  ORF Transcript_136448/g.308351 Transcript_136448/m.308351 type:complete len:434 (-) Transcript_136448:92-1393(-)
MVQSRNVQYVLMMLARTLQQCHRQTLPPLCQAMAKDLGFGIAEKGSLMGAVAVGYLLTQIPGGLMADVLGAKPTITLAIAGSTALMVATSAASSFEMLWLCIAIMGGMQGPLFPTSSVYLSRWSPPDERAKAASMLDVGVSVGSILIVPIASFLETLLGWRNTYLVVAAVSAAYVLAFVVLGAESPATCKRISDEERQFLQSVVIQKKKPAAGEASVSVIGVLFHPAVLTVFFAHLAFNYGFYFLSNWMPEYFSSVFGMDSLQSSTFVSCVSAANMVAVLTINPLVDHMMQQRQFTLLGRRRVFTCVGCFVAVVALVPVYRLNALGPIGTTALFAVGNVGFALQTWGFKANYLDVTVDFTGLVSGVGNTVGTVSSMLGPLITGRILAGDTAFGMSSWTVALLLVGVLSAVSALLFRLFSEAEPVEAGIKAKMA